MISSVFEFFKEWWTAIDGFITMGTLGAVFYNIWQNKKQMKNIPFFIEQNGKICEIKVYLLRKNCTRSEVKGILRELHKGTASFEINYISNPKTNFLQDLEKIQQGKKDEIVIKIKSDDTFELKEF